MSDEGGKKVVSSKSFERLVQEQGNWCYAATERAIKLAYGVEVGSQHDIALNYWTNIEQPKMDKHGEFVSALKEGDADMTDDDAKAEATRMIRENAVEQNRGNYQFNNGPSNQLIAGSPATEEQIKASIDGGNLGIIGAGAHLTLLYGYEEDSSGKITKLLRWDTLAGQEDPMTWATYSGGSGYDTILFG
jgi:hypothetical protein